MCRVKKATQIHTYFFPIISAYNRSLHKSIQSDDSTVTDVDDDPLVGTMDMDHVSQQLETLVSVGLLLLKTVASV